MLPPTPSNEEERLLALRRTGLLDSPDETFFDDIARLAAHSCGTPTALVSLVDGTRQWFKARVGMEVRETPRDVAFCAHAILQDEIFEVQDALADDRFRDNPLVTEAPGVRFYAGAPLITSEGHALGTVCAIDDHPRQLTAAQREALLALSRLVVGELDRRRKDRSP
jgi:GAF domain-containing protein